MLKRRRLGRTGFEASILTLGGAGIGCEPQREADKAIGKAFKYGVNMLDIAPTYGDSELRVASWVQKYRGKIFLAEKTAQRTQKGAWEELQNSLKRIGVERFDLYQIHRFDDETPLEETVRAMDDLVRQGKVRYIGCSAGGGDPGAWKLAKALAISALRGYVAFVSFQPRYSLVSREIEASWMPLCRDNGIGIIPYSPQGRGFLSGKYTKGQPPPQGTRAQQEDRQLIETLANEKNWRILERVTAIGRERGKSAVQIALNWVLCQPGITSPIVGATSVEQLEESLGALGWALEADELQRIEDV